VFEARKIIYPRKGADAWWDLKQLVEQTKNTLTIFEYAHPNCIGIFVFNCSSTYEGFAENALNVNDININLGKKQKKMCNTIIPLNNPGLAPSEEDTHERVQQMCFPEDHSDPVLRGKPKGLWAVLMECKSIWDKYIAMCKAHGAKVVGKCGTCTKSDVRKDAECCVVHVEVMGQEHKTFMQDIRLAKNEMPSGVDNEWCCMHQVLLLQEDFQNEKPLLQHVIENAGHVCVFLP
jgi:hypothetical protein